MAAHLLFVLTLLYIYKIGVESERKKKDIFFDYFS